MMHHATAVREKMKIRGGFSLLEQGSKTGSRGWFVIAGAGDP
jgi:hypothetical protein